MFYMRFINATTASGTQTQINKPSGHICTICVLPLNIPNGFIDILPSQ